MRRDENLESIKLHKTLYSATSIGRAMETFKSHALLQMREAGFYFEITVSSEDSNEREVASELANHALAFTVEEVRAGECNLSQ
jgi:hypothetical protein